MHHMFRGPAQTLRLTGMGSGVVRAVVGSHSLAGQEEHPLGRLLFGTHDRTRDAHDAETTGDARDVQNRTRSQTATSRTPDLTR